MVPSLVRRSAATRSETRALRTALGKERALAPPAHFLLTTTDSVSWNRDRHFVRWWRRKTGKVFPFMPDSPPEAVVSPVSQPRSARQKEFFFLPFRSLRWPVRPASVIPHDGCTVVWIPGSPSKGSAGPEEVRMIVVMKQGADRGQIDHVIEQIEQLGLRSHVIVGTELHRRGGAGRETRRGPAGPRDHRGGGQGGADPRRRTRWPPPRSRRSRRSCAVLDLRVGGRPCRRHRRALLGREPASRSWRSPTSSRRRGRPACAAGRSSRAPARTASRG